MLFIYALLIGITAGVVVAKIDPQKVKLNYIGTIIAGLLGALIPSQLLDLVILGDSTFPIIQVTETALGMILATFSAFLFAFVYRVIYRSDDIFNALKSSFGYSNSSQYSYKKGRPAYVGLKGGKTNSEQKDNNNTNPDSQPDSQKEQEKNNQTS